MDFPTESACHQLISHVQMVALEYKVIASNHGHDESVFAQVYDDLQYTYHDLFVCRLHSRSAADQVVPQFAESDVEARLRMNDLLDSLTMVLDYMHQVAGALFDV